MTSVSHFGREALCLLQFAQGQANKLASDDFVGWSAVCVGVLAGFPVQIGTGILFELGIF
ncbi:MAG TPA: hypothetical protein DEF45_03025 [Rhodopirellula sp.]|nr:hypothetical protein [Rhodopirellula sp.]